MAARTRRARGNPAHRGKTRREGLWRYSRHPNDFFEWLHWFTCIALAAGSSLAWVSLSGPVLMYVFLRWVKRDYAWIMARTPQISNADYVADIQRLQQLGYDTSKPGRVPQHPR
jgi:hypothetical protein